MRKFYLFQLAFILLSAGSISESISFSHAEPLIVECARCEEEYKNCIDAAGKIYTTAVVKAADSSRSKSSKVNYSVACEEARRIKNKAISECTEAYNKCCLAAAKENNKTKKEEQ